MSDDRVEVDVEEIRRTDAAILRAKQVLFQLS